MEQYHGQPCWFELSTSDVDAAKAFYEPLMGWTVGASEMPDFDYRLAKHGGDAVAGFMSLAALPPGTPPNWLTYIAVKNADETARLAVEKGGKVTKGPDDIPGTGRFAVLTDPQGAYFGILQPAPMEREPSPDQFAWNQQKAGRGNWLELMSTDPKAGFDYYAALFGWTRGTAMPMGEAGDYQIFERNGTQIGGMMALGDSPVPNWLPYFGADGKVSDMVARIDGSGGHVHAGPMEVPGPAWIAVGHDPQGAWFAVVGGER